MRLDLALYGVAILLFALAAVVFVVVPTDSGQLVYTVSIAVLALLMAATGYVVRPKAQVPARVQPVTAPSSPAAEPVQQASPIEVPVAQAASVEVPVVEAPPPQPSKETPQSPMEVPASPGQVESVVATPVLSAPEPAPQLSAPAESPALSAVVPAAAVSDLTTIRGINAKWAEQLKANGINSIEDLAKASSEDLAAKLAVSLRIVKMWVGSAKKQTK